jgi:hypothetical protein
MKPPQSKQEIESSLQRLLQSGKPAIIVAAFRNEGDFTDQQIRHFKSSPPYLWNLKLHDKEHMGVLMDENLNYVHIVFATNEMMNYTIGLSHEIEPTNQS